MSFNQLLHSTGGEHEIYQGLPVPEGPANKLLKGVLVNRDQHLIEFEANIAAIEHDGEPALLVSLRDLSYRKNLEKQLRQFQKMEAIGTLAGGVAHDFNNILSAIIGYTELTVRKIPLANPVHNYLQQILKAGERARSLIKQILTFSRQTEQEDDKIVRVDLIIKEVLRLLRATIPTSIEIEQDIAPDCYARIDPILVHQTDHELWLSMPRMPCSRRLAFFPCPWKKRIFRRPTGKSSAIAAGNLYPLWRCRTPESAWMRRSSTGYTSRISPPKSRG